MHKLWAIFKREYTERVRSRWFVISTVFGPVLFASLMFLPAYLASRNKGNGDVSRITIIDASGSSLGTRVASGLGGGPLGDASLAHVVVVSDGNIAKAESLATRAVLAGSVRGYLTLEGGASHGFGIRYAGTNATNIADMQKLESTVRREVLAQRLTEAGVSSADADAIKGMTVNVRPERLSADGRGGSGRVNIVFAISIAMLLYVTILIYGQNVLRGVVEEKTSRVAEVIVASVRPPILLAGKVLGVGAVGLTQVVIWTTSSVVIAKVRAPLSAKLGVAAMPLPLPSVSIGMLLLLILFFVLGYTLYSAMFAAVGAMVSNEQDAQQAQMPIVLILVTCVTLLQSAITNPDGRMATNLSLIPFSAPIAMPLRLASVNVPAWDIFASIVLLLATCYLAIYAAARIYRTGLLMYGKRPSFREVLKWIPRSSR